MNRKFEDIKTGNVFWNLHNDGLLRCLFSKVTYTIDEAEKSTDLHEKI